MWTKRLFNNWSKKRQSKQEYKEKYQDLLSFNYTNVESYKKMELQSDYMNISIGDDLFYASREEAWTMHTDMIKKFLSKYLGNNNCELGCGYGYNFSLFPKNIYGGDISENARLIAKKANNKVYKFDFNCRNDYSIIKDNCTIYTIHAIEQIKKAKTFIDNLSRHKNKINIVVNYEPCIIPERTSLLGLFRNKYTIANDYNTDLASVLQSRSDIEIIEKHIDYFGLNPLNSTNIFVWRFKNADK
jgi:hypothetical protein